MRDLASFTMAKNRGECCFTDTSSKYYSKQFPYGIIFHCVLDPRVPSLKSLVSSLKSRLEAVDKGLEPRGYLYVFEVDPERV